tara:strand:+ start:200 stop:643 length:444 start_codon:yes stop_codon:yes gene_type:complete
MNDNPIEITSRKYPIIANMIFDGIGQENCEDILWQNVIDTVSEIEQNEIGVSVTQSYQYTKLNNEPTIMVRWQGIKTANGSEFRIGLGLGKPADKNTPPIMSGNMKTGVQVNSTLSIESVKLGCINGEFAIEKDGKWYAIQIGEAIE